MLLEPFGQRIIVRRKVTEKIGLIHVPESSQKTSLEGEVIAVGPEAEWAKLGDKVLFWKHSGFTLPSELPGYGDCLLMNSEDLLALIKTDQVVPEYSSVGMTSTLSSEENDAGK